MIYLGFPGRFKKNPALVILDPDFSWASEMRKESTEQSSPDTAYALRIDTILVEAKTFWALDLPDNLVPVLKKLQAEHSAPPTKRSKKDDPGDPGNDMAGKVMRAVSQIYGYMSVNHLQFGVLATFEKFIFLRRTSSAEGSAPVLEITKVIKRDQTRQFHEFTLMEAWLGLMMVAEKDHLFTSPYPSPDVKQRTLKIKQPIELVRSARIGNLYFAERITRGGCGCERGITCGQLGVVVDGGIYGQDEKNSVMKIIDTSKDSHKAKKLRLEMDAYRALESLQGQIVPKVHGFLLIHNWIMVLVLSQCGNNIESVQFVARYGEIRGMLKKIHAAGVVHGDLARRNILIGKKEKITIIDFSEAKLRSISTEDFSKGCKEDWACLKRLLETSKRNSDTR